MASFRLLESMPRVSAASVVEPGNTDMFGYSSMMVLRKRYNADSFAVCPAENERARERRPESLQMLSSQNLSPASRKKKNLFVHLTCLFWRCSQDDSEVVF